MNHSDVHAFHIPVMGLAFTIDTPVKVARFGINSVVSIVEDRLVEMMRQYYYEKAGIPFQPIRTNEEGYKHRRITDYLNLLRDLVDEQVLKLKNLPLAAGSELSKYFEMLPQGSILKNLYEQYCRCSDPQEKISVEKKLRHGVRAGSIDVNIMTKIDKDNFSKDGELIPDGSDALAALKGYAESKLTNSSVVLSAGMNPRLYNYLSKLSAFHPDEDGNFEKKVVIKVSDYRSASIQGMYLAKKGVWVSEFRIESGLNCGGHAFATQGKLMGIILEEFKSKRAELLENTFNEYNKVLLLKTGRCFKYPPLQKISVQGGLGTNEERELLHRRYGVDGTGWGSPFLLVPEATTVDEQTLVKLQQVKEGDIILSDVSPLGVKFYYLKNHTGEKEKEDRIVSGRPGSPCTEKHLSFNTEFTTEPICTASTKYQKLKINQLESMELPTVELERRKEAVLAKECLCVGLSNPAAEVTNKSFIKNIKGITICPGPNMVWFTRVVSLQTMTDHIYGRKNIIQAPDRPHVFINELYLYLNYFKNEMLHHFERNGLTVKSVGEFAENLRAGIEYYSRFTKDDVMDHSGFTKHLREASLILEEILTEEALADTRSSSR